MKKTQKPDLSPLSNHQPEVLNSDPRLREQNPMNYKDSGVDVEAGDDLVDWLSEKQAKTPHQNRILSGIGGFASLFRIDFPEFKKPCLVTCTDGVGTKVKIASQFERYESVGQDLVAMCVNDLICTGGQPLMFLDYYATGKLHLPWAKTFLTGVRKACLESDCALIGGETAEMPGVYHDNDFDCAGFAVGIVDQDKTLGPDRVRKGDRLLAIASSGFHSNGYSLLRKVFSQDLAEWKDILLKPTALYVQVMKKLLTQTEVHAAAHITGGGIDNIPRVLPADLNWKMKEWEIPSPFLEVQKRTQLSTEQLRKTLNCGIGFVLVMPPSQIATAQKVIDGFEMESFEIGELH